MSDVDGRVWTFEEKAPVVSDENLNAASHYPRPGSLVCTILARDGATVRVGLDPLSGYFECRVPTTAVEELNS